MRWLLDRASFADMAPSSHKSNIRRAWLAERIGDGTSDAKLVALAAVTFNVQEVTIRKDLSAVYSHWMEIWSETEPARVAKFMELGMNLLEECRAAGRTTMHFGPAVQQFKNLAIMSGTMRDGLSSRSDPTPTGDTRPDDVSIRERIDALQKDPGVRERAMRAGIDLAKVK